MFNSPFSMVVAIVLIVFVSSAFNNWLKTRRLELKAQTEGTNDDLQAQVEHLEHRVQVLERIITDSGNDLRREIDRL